MIHERNGADVDDNDQRDDYMEHHHPLWGSLLGVKLAVAP